MEMYYIQNGWVGNDILWWKKGDNGYTTDFLKAKAFTKDEALKLIDGRAKYRAWPCSYVDEQKDAHILVIDSQYLDSSNLLKG